MMIPKPEKEKRKRHKMTIECDISAEVRKIVYERDIKSCVCCGSSYQIEVAHYIRRSQGGRGIPENLVCLCKHCHRDYDEKSEQLREMLQEEIERHLKRHYPQWNKDNLVYDKWKDLDPSWRFDNSV